MNGKNRELICDPQLYPQPNTPGRCPFYPDPFSKLFWPTAPRVSRSVKLLLYESFVSHAIPPDRKLARSTLARTPR